MAVVCCSNVLTVRTFPVSFIGRTRLEYSVEFKVASNSVLISESVAAFANAMSTVKDMILYNMIPILFIFCHLTIVSSLMSVKLFKIKLFENFTRLYVQYSHSSSP